MMATCHTVPAAAELSSVFWSGARRLATLRALEAAFHARTPLAIATILEGSHIGRRCLRRPDHNRIHSSAHLQSDAEIEGRSILRTWRHWRWNAAVNRSTASARWRADARLGRLSRSPAGLWIFSAGDDAKPLLRLARELGWFVAVADGRTHLATRERFPAADEVTRAADRDLARSGVMRIFRLKATDAAVVMTHSFEQDSQVLASLFALEVPACLSRRAWPAAANTRSSGRGSPIASTCRLQPSASKMAGAHARPYRPRSRRGNPCRHCALDRCGNSADAELPSAGLPLRQVRAVASGDHAGVVTSSGCRFTWPGALPALPEISPATPDAPSTPVP